VVILTKCGNKRWYTTLKWLKNEIFRKYNLKRWFSRFYHHKNLQYTFDYSIQKTRRNKHIHKTHMGVLKIGIPSFTDRICGNSHGIRLIICKIFHHGIFNQKLINASGREIYSLNDVLNQSTKFKFLIS
jgi:hypothetical protein